jgi:hypothetical protein
VDLFFGSFSRLSIGNPFVAKIDDPTSAAKPRSVVISYFTARIQASLWTRVDRQLGDRALTGEQNGPHLSGGSMAL